MRTREDVDSYLLRTGLPYQEIEEGMWIVRDSDAGENVVIRIAGPLVLFRAKVLGLEAITRREELFHRLLELNASEMVHGAYGITDDAVVLTHTLRLENLDYNELQGTIDDFSLAVTNHYETLAAFRTAH